MTTQYDPDECERLIRELREDDARMSLAPWVAASRIVYSDDPDEGTVEVAAEGDDCSEHDAAAIARTRNNLGALADQLEAARAEIEHWREARRVAVEAGEILKSELDRMRSVVEASEPMRDGHEGCVTEPPCDACFRCDFDHAIDAYRASKP